MNKYDRLIEKFERFLGKNGNENEWIEVESDWFFDDFYCLSSIGEMVEDYWTICELLNRAHNKKLLERSMKYEENSIRRFLNSKNSELLQVQAASYLQKRSRYVDNENNAILLYIDFKDAANVKDLSDEQETFLRTEFKKAKRDFDSGKYDYEDEE